MCVWWLLRTAIKMLEDGIYIFLKKIFQPKIIKTYIYSKWQRKKFFFEKKFWSESFQNSPKRFLKWKYWSQILLPLWLYFEHKAVVSKKCPRQKNFSKFVWSESIQNISKCILKWKSRFRNFLSNNEFSREHSFEHIAISETPPSFEIWTSWLI